MTENYRKAEELVVKGLATKSDRDCIEFEVGNDEAYAWIYPSEELVTVYYGEDYYDYGDIDLKSMTVVGREDNYDIIKEVH